MNLSPATHTAADVVRLLGLEPLPHEGGWFRRTAEGERPNPGAPRAWSMIQALFSAESFSALHRVDADELWLWQAGDPLAMWCLFPDGPVRPCVLGRDSEGGQVLQRVVPAGVWQGARVADGGRWTLVSCIMVPEFRWELFSLGDRTELETAYPGAAAAIRRLTRSPG